MIIHCLKEYIHNELKLLTRTLSGAISKNL